MREILFRGKRIDNGEWVQGFYIHHRNVAHYIIDIQHGGYEDIDGGFFVPRWYAVNPNTIGQYTGLTDKNGKRIFEGDIVDILTENEEIGIVAYDDGGFLVNADGFDVDFHSNINGTDLEVIGNIHDNPELLKGENK